MGNNPASTSGAATSTEPTDAVPEDTRASLDRLFDGEADPTLSNPGGRPSPLPNTEAHDA